GVSRDRRSGSRRERHLDRSYRRGFYRLRLARAGTSAGLKLTGGRVYSIRVGPPTSQRASSAQRIGFADGERRAHRKEKTPMISTFKNFQNLRANPTEEAAQYLRFRTSSGIRALVSRGELKSRSARGRTAATSLRGTFSTHLRRHAHHPRRVGWRAFRGEGSMRKTRYRGIMQLGANLFEIRARAIDPRTRSEREVRRTRECTLAEAAKL